jgi:hypothetical protein
MDAKGNVYARSFRPSASELATEVMASEPVATGDILVIDPSQPGWMRLAREEADTRVFGVVSATAGVVLGAVPPAAGADAGSSQGLAEAGSQVAVALSGIVLCKVDAAYGGIEAGDLLITSPTAGHAMRAATPQAGTVVGKALEPLAAGTGTIRILVTLR